MQFEKAAQEYCYILSADPTQQNMVESRVFQNISRPGALDVTLRVIEDCAEENNLSYAFLLTKLYVEKKSFQKAYKIYLDIDERLSSQGRELYNFARQMFAEKEYSLAAEVFKAITDRYPDSPIASSAYLGYARSLEASLFEDYEKTLPLWKPYFPMEKFQSEKTQEVLNTFNLVINLYKHSEPAYESILRTAVIKFYLLKDYTDAKRLLETIVNEAPLSQNSAEAYLELGNIAMIEGNLLEAERNFSAITNLRNADEDQKNRAIYKLGKVNFYQGKFEEAKKNLSQILTNLKDNSANDALELLLLLNPQVNDSSNLLIYAEAEFLSEQKKFDEAAINYKKLAENQMAFVLRSISAVKYGEMLLAVDQYPESISALEGVAAEGEKNIYADKAVYLLAKINQYGIENHVKAEEYYQQLLADYPKSIYADDARAQILLLQNKPGT
jgi:TolA-binding protein